MFCQINQTDELNTIVVSGRLDTTTAPELETLINENLDVSKNVDFNMEKLEYISSAGLRILLQTKKKVNGKTVSILHPSEEVKEILDVTGFTDMFTIVA